MTSDRDNIGPQQICFLQSRPGIFCSAVIHRLFGNTWSQSQLQIILQSFQRRNLTSTVVKKIFLAQSSYLDAVDLLGAPHLLLFLFAWLNSFRSLRLQTRCVPPAGAFLDNDTTWMGILCSHKASGASLWHFTFYTALSLPFTFRLLCWTWCSPGAEIELFVVRAPVHDRVGVQ